MRSESVSCILGNRVALARALVTAILSLAVFAAGGITANAKDTDWTTAVNISVNTDVYGNIEQGYDYEKDLYKFVISEDGVVSLSFFNPLQSDSSTYWEVFLYDSDYSELLKRSIGGNRESHYLTRMGLAAGTYYIRVSSPRWSSTETTDTYTLNVGFTASGTWEKEFNEEFTSATYMQVNTDYYGTTKSGYDYEKDYYCFDLDSSGAISISVRYDQLGSTDACYKVTLYHSDYDDICSFRLSGADSVNELTPVGLPAGRYYICITSPNWNSAETTNTYTLNVGFAAGDNWEKEFNEDFTSATAVMLGERYGGALHSEDDLDYYSFDITESNNYRLTVETQQQGDSDNHYYAVLYDSHYEKLSEMQLPGNKDRHNMDGSLSEGRYYLEMKKAGYNSVVYEPYYISIGKYPGNNSESYDDNSGESGNDSGTYDDYTGKDLAYAEVSLSNDTYPYTGNECRPDVYVYLGGEWVDSDEYYVNYYDNVDAGTATVEVVAGDYSDYYGSTAASFKINRRKLTKKHIYVNDLTYNGKNRKPVIHYWGFDENDDYFERSLYLGKQYKITKGSKKFKKIGKYSFTVSGTGNYYGKVKMTMTIRPKNPKGLKTAKRGKSNITVRWKKVNGASGYCVQTYNSNGKAVKHYTKKTSYTLKADKDYYVGATIYSYKKVGKKKILSSGKYFYDYVKPSKKPSFTVSTGFSQYEIKYSRWGNYMVEFSTTKDFSNATGSNFWKGGTSTLTRTLGSCYGKTEWFRTRQYVVTRSGRILAGPWSKPRKVRVY